jgi:hypothetical protein
VPRRDLQVAARLYRTVRSRQEEARVARATYWFNRFRQTAPSVTTRPTFAFTSLVELPRRFGVSGPLTARMFDITKEGRILGLASPVSESQSNYAQIQVVLNWHEELKQRVPTR